MQNATQKLQITPIGMSFGNCLQLRVENKVLLIDCGRCPQKLELDASSHLFGEDQELSESLGDEMVVYRKLKPHFQSNDEVHVWLSHCHLDHIGGVRALNKLSQQIGFSLHCHMTTFTAKVSEKRDFHTDNCINDKFVDYNTFSSGIPQEFGPFTITPWHVSHSTPQTHIFQIEYSGQYYVWLTDFTFRRFTDEQIEETKLLLRYLAIRRPKLVFVEALYFERETGDFTPSETIVTKTISKILAENNNSGRRTIISLFGSNVDRVSNIFTEANKLKLNTWIVGAPWLYYKAAIETNLDVYPVQKKLETFGGIEAADVLIVSGCQAEKGAVLTRASGIDGKEERRNLILSENDTVIMSSMPIPGNEERYFQMLTAILELGASVCLPNEIANVHQIIRLISQYPGQLQFDSVHVSGHESWHGIKTALEILNPQVVVPYHGYPHQLDALATKITRELPAIKTFCMKESKKYLT